MSIQRRVTSTTTTYDPPLTRNEEQVQLLFLMGNRDPETLAIIDGILARARTVTTTTTEWEN